MIFGAHEKPLNTSPANLHYNMKTNMAVVACDAIKFIQGHPK